MVQLELCNLTNLLNETESIVGGTVACVDGDADPLQILLSRSTSVNRDVHVMNRTTRPRVEMSFSKIMLKKLEMIDALTDSYTRS